MSPNAPPSWQRVLGNARWQALLIAGVVFAAYASSITAPFQLLDDPLYLTSNPRIQDGSLRGFVRLWSPAAALSGKFIEYFPLRDSVYWLVWKLFGANSAPFHVVNMVSHGMTSFLVGRFALRLGLPAHVAGTAALIFAAHPTHLESVAWLAGLKDPLYTALLLAACLSWLDLRDGTTDTRGWMPAFRSVLRPTVLVVGALLCKSMAFVAPALFFVLSVVINRRRDWGTLAQQLALPTLVCVGFVAFFVIVGRANDVVRGPWFDSWLTHFGVVVWVLARYFQQAVVPNDFRLHYCFETVGEVFRVHVVIGILFVVTYLGVCFALRRTRLPLLLLLWGPICLFPVMNIIPFPALMADRYLYAASIAVCLALAVAISAAPRRFMLLLVVSAVGVLAGVTGLRGLLWHTPEKLWLPVVEDPVCQGDVYATLNLANTLISVDPEASLNYFLKAMRSEKFAAKERAQRCRAHFNVGRLAVQLNRPELAAESFQTAANTCDDNVKALADAMLAAGGDPEAELQTATAAAEAMRNPGTVWNLAIARLRLGLDAKKELDEALGTSPRILCPLAVTLADQPGELTRDEKLHPRLVAAVQAAVTTHCQR